MENVLVVAVNGSPNSGGNTAFLLQEVLKAAEEAGAATEFINCMDVLEGQKRPYCIACSSPCKGACYKNTELEEVYNRLAEADAVVLGSPVYFGTVSAQLKAIFDKSRKLRAEKGLAGKVGAGVSVGASRFGGQETTLRAIHDIMLVHGMSVISDSSVAATIGHHGVCAQKPAQDDADAIKSAHVVGKRLVEEAIKNR